MNYLIELKQLVTYPRCRIYRRFMTTLMKSKNIRTCGTSYLFFYMILCAFASYTILAGSWAEQHTNLKQERESALSWRG